MIEIIPNQQTPKATEEADPVVDKVLINECMEYVKTLKDCAGMAANQLSKEGVRINKRFFFARKDVLTQEWLIFLNPVITDKFGKTDITIEGCLTWVGRKIYVRRWMNISVYYTTIDVVNMEGDLEGFSAQVYQHEADHLNGVIEHFMDETSKVFQMRNELCKCCSGLKYKKCCGLVKSN